nr:PREDICTED: uncharacterized protein LOC109036923 [Bemisia tabaci]
MINEFYYELTNSTFSKGIHGGINQGNNWAEAVNFVDESWGQHERSEMRFLDSCEAGFDWEERVHERLLACAGGKSSARLKTNPTSEPTPHPAPEPVASTSRQENQGECWICKRPAIRETKRRPLCQQHYMKRINKEIKKKKRRRN